jgi:hypothetical protein
MTTRVLFIHGTMTRFDEDYQRAFARITRRFKDWRGSTIVERFPWGEFWGAELNPSFRAIPGADERDPGAVMGAPATSAAVDMEAILWELLYDDPQGELRLLIAGAEPVAALLPPSQAAKQLRAAVNALPEAAITAPLNDLLTRGDLSVAFAHGVALAQQSFRDEPFAGVLRGLQPEAAAVYRTAFARLIVAEAIRATQAGGGYAEAALDADLRDATVAAVEHALGAGAGVQGRAADWLSFLPATAATHLLLRPRRVDLTRGILKFLGDILVYQSARGQHIRAGMLERLTPAPTVLLAHSLGGIACVDLLRTSAEARAQVPLLITVGSQAGMLHEIGALGDLGPAGAEPTPLPPDFPPWLNLYDPNDLLSFRAAPLFAGRVRDVALRSAQPFPHAHSAYWRNDQAWEHILTAVAEPQNVMYQLR